MIFFKQFLMDKTSAWLRENAFKKSINCNFLFARKKTEKK